MFKKMMLISGAVVSGIANATSMTDTVTQKIKQFGTSVEQGAKELNEKAKQGVTRAGEKVGEVAGRYYGGKKAKETYEKGEEKVANAAQQVKETGEKAAKTLKEFFIGTEQQPVKKSVTTSLMTSGLKGTVNSLFAALRQYGLIGKEITLEKLGEMDAEQFFFKALTSKEAAPIISTFISYLERAPQLLAELADMLNHIQEQADAKRKDYQLTAEQRKVLQQLIDAIENIRNAFCEHAQQNN